MFKRENHLAKKLHAVMNFIMSLGGQGIDENILKFLVFNYTLMKLLGRLMRTFSKLDDCKNTLSDQIQKMLENIGMDIDFLELLLIEYGWLILKRGKMEGVDHDEGFSIRASKNIGNIDYFMRISVGVYPDKMFKVIDDVFLSKETSFKAPERRSFYNLDEKGFKNIVLRYEEEF